MFGLTKREQRWKAEQAALTAIAPVVVALAGAHAVREASKPKKPNLDVATTQELRDELRKRGE